MHKDPDALIRISSEELNRKISESFAKGFQKAIEALKASDYQTAMMDVDFAKYLESNQDELLK